ncbi:hypothetical protein E1292_36760 [Nonomuraea deserti]|uniref:Uncharacterized protein n=1 Tax=Nonomuraea deserti TaxID=1848322 RepID=A0A4R4V5H6_9ACTN|nr:hypothetical protein [Nonomuraea deserti]TDC97572.1 hypothetical protein E1292_36760 [Nonomuraea deserti]
MMRNVRSRAVRTFAGTAAALLATVLIQGPAAASSGALYPKRVEHGSDYAIVWTGTRTVVAFDGEKDGNDVVAQVRWWDSRWAEERVHNEWDRKPDKKDERGKVPGVVREIRVCEETGSCSDWE